MPESVVSSQVSRRHVVRVIRSATRRRFVTIVSLLLGAALFGILGVLLAIPTAAAIQIILRDWWSARSVDEGGSDSGAENGNATA